MFTRLLELLAQGLLPQGLGTILGSLNLGEIQVQAFSFLNTAFDLEAGAKAAHELSHVIVKGLENAQNPASGLGVEERIAVGTALGQNTALAYSVAGEAILKLVEAQAAEERVRGTSSEDAARGRRNAAEKAARAAIEAIPAAAAGKLKL